ncbi:hypothetical protein [Micromonospora sp. NPDC005806]|uniref:hypothetical protein n=1 Tax=Micromonospora sp. NPDC005806 TaxID=3364234 RepID=UPI0036AFF4AB
MRGVCRIGECAERVALSPQQELVEDLLVVVRAFSWRLGVPRPFMAELGAGLTGAGDQ